LYVDLTLAYYIENV